MRNREFMVFYKCTNGNEGYTCITTKNGLYLNRKKVFDALSIFSEKENIIIKNIIELSVNDMKQWWAKDLPK